MSLYPQHIVFTLPDGVRIAVPPNLRCMTTYILLEQKDWFEDDIKFLRHAIKPGMHVIDIGANLGVYTLTMAHAVGQTGHVYAFEPAAQTADYLRCSLDLNDFRQVTLDQAGVSSHSGTARLFHDRVAELYRVDLDGQAGDDEGTHEPIILKRLDEIIDQHNDIQIDFIKMDAEGHERAIIKGGYHLLTRQAPIVMFEVINHLSRVNVDVLDAFMAMEYALFVLLPGLQILMPVDLTYINRFGPLNVYAIKTPAKSFWYEQGMISVHPDAFDITGKDWHIALLLWQQSQDISASADQRVGALQIAGNLMLEHNGFGQSLSFYLSAACIFKALGWQNLAADALRAALDIWQNTAERLTEYPKDCLMPMNAPDDCDVHDAIGRIIIMLLDHLSGYSSYFRLDESLANSQHLIDMPGTVLPETRRRYLLSRALKFGELPSTLLAIPGFETLTI